CENGEKCISRKSFLRFLQVLQRDPRLNEARHPKMSERGMDNLLKSLGYPKGVDISFPVFVHYLWSDFCADSLNITQEQVDEQMHEPLPCYFINSSHNTYCIGLQVKGAQLFPSSSHREALADVEIYRQVADALIWQIQTWDGSDGPVVTHGPAAVMRMNEIPLKIVLYGYADDCVRFKVSPYPVLLSIENHLCQQQQKLMVQIFRETFGSKLLVDALETHPDQSLPSPYALRYKIIIKAKKSKPKIQP
ncbi:Phosphatidylinositol-specific phospholipase C, X domain protein, partial [Ostertagia ostertagi]